MRHIKLVVQYDGTDYAGFQIQPDAPTIQGELEQALAGILGRPSKVIAASRTDAGVHAIGQVVRVDTENPIPVDNLVRAMNGSLPRAIVVSEGQLVSGDFHPRYDAVRKTYEYRIRNCPERSPFRDLFEWHIAAPLDAGAMAEAGARLVGEHDFSAFAVSGGSVTSSVRELYTVECTRRDENIRLTFCGNGFLYMMVRSIVGTLVEVGRGKRPAQAMEGILASRDRSEAGKTAPPQGLFLMQVSYADGAEADHLTRDAQ